MLNNERNPRINPALTHEHSTGTSFPPQGPDDPGDHDPLNKEKKKFPLWARVTAGVAGLALVGTGVGVGVAISKDGSEKAKAVATAPATPNAEKTPSAEQNPSQSEQPELTQASLEFDSNSTPEQWAEKYAQDFNDWRMAGTGEKAYNEALDYNGSSSDYAQEVATKNSSIFANAIYGPDWQNDSDVSYTVNYMAQQNQQSIILNIATFKEENPYEWKDSVQSVKVLSTDGDNSIVEIVTTSSNNGNENRAGEISPELKGLEGDTSTQDITFTKKGDSVYVTSVVVK